MNVVIYARFSSHSQTEQSIEGQLKVCYEYAESNHYTVVGEYIDRAISGTTDNRAEFQRMISDSDRHTFEGVLVYQLDRFARNRYDSAINKAKLKKNGVRVLSAKENIADDASGILVEGVLESMAEYYSVELSQKIHRGMAINAEKCLSNGSNPGLGFKVDAERRFYVDEEEAAIVREIYERYASGETKAEIIRDLKRRRVKTSLGKEFSPNSLSHLLSNKRYIGVYLYKGKETPGGMPRILDDDLFYRVQSMMNKNKNAPARTHGEGEYLLTTKLFCGHCKEMMVGYGGTSKTGRQYHYYMCKNARRKKCGKKIVSKSYIEDRVVNECLKMLTEEKIRFIAKKVAEECAKSPDNLTAKALKKAIREADTAIENLWKAIEQGQAVEMLTDRLNKRMAEKAELEAQLAIEENKKITLTEAQILAFLDYVCEMPADDVNKRRAIINIFVHSIYLYDDHFTLIINASKKPLNIDNIPLDDINDGVHPTEGGYAKLGQMIYETMLGVHSGDSGGGQVTPLWDMTGRTGVQWQEYSDGNVGRSFGTDKYYYPLSFAGTTQSPTAATMTDFAVGTDTLEFTIQTGSASASQLSGYGIVVPLALEAGKSYTFAAKCASANSGVNLMTYNVSGGVWTYVSNARVCYSTTELCSASITPEAGKGYAICFSQKSGGVGTKNVFSQISLKES